MLVGEPEKALDKLEPLLKVPYFVSRALAEDRPQLRTAAGNPRFQKLVAGAKEMTLSAGTRLGPYEILAPLGAGGMGEVYRARDTKLDREVAVKVLPSHSTANADALARFEREAKAVAALSHPNILAIFDFGTHDGVSYAVTELLEGETLRGKLGRLDPDAEAGGRLGAPDRAGPLRRARQGRRSPRPEARERLRDQRRARQDPGLRPGEARRRGSGRADERADGHRLRPHRARHGDGHDGLHVARAGPRPARRPPLGPLLLRRDPVRAALRARRRSSATRRATRSPRSCRRSRPS